MPLVNMKDMLDHAYGHNYAVGAFELVNLDFLRGVMAAAERCRAPVILSLGEPHLEIFDFDLLISAVECAARRASVPVAIHMHHGRDLESAVRAINCGCNGVMVDASDGELGSNIAVTREVVAMVRSRGVPVEGKLGFVPYSEGENPQASSGGAEYTATTVAEARAYVDRTGVDFLAVSVGTVRGRMKTRPKLNWQRLKQINETLNIPLTIYDGTGLSQSQFTRLIAHGVAKINYFAGLDQVAFEQVRSSVRENPKGHYTSVVDAVREAVEQETENCLRVWGAAGRAAEVLEQCRHWVPAGRVVACEVKTLDDGGIDEVVGEEARSGNESPRARYLLRQQSARR